MDNEKGEAPYEPDYKGFDAKRTREAQATHDRSQEGASAKGEDANAAYMEEGPDEAARRTGRSKKDLGDSIENAAKRARK